MYVFYTAIICGEGSASKIYINTWWLPVLNKIKKDSKDQESIQSRTNHPYQIEK